MSRLVLLAVMAVLSVSCSERLANDNFECQQLDVTANLPNDQDRALDAMGAEWLNDAIVCKINDVLFIAPRDPSVAEYIINRKGEDEIARGASTLLIMDDSNVHVFLQDSDDDGHFDEMSLDTWRSPHAYLSTRDWNLDGQIDIRDIKGPDGVFRHEAWVDGEWHEYTMDRGFRLVADPSKKIRFDEDKRPSIVDDAD